MHTVTRQFQFDAAHRVLGHQGRCRFLHGHLYTVDVTVTAPKLDALGMVVDFAVLKDTIGKWIHDKLDHNVILHKDDPLLLMVNEADSQVGGGQVSGLVFAGRTPFVMLVNPTAENLAKLIYEMAQDNHHRGLDVVSVKVSESPGCWAEYTPDQEGK